MSLDLEKLRKLAQEDSIRGADESKKMEDALNEKARRMAKEDAPKWAQSIEKAILEGHWSRHGGLALHYGVSGKLFPFPKSYYRFWTNAEYETHSSSKIGPRIDITELAESWNGRLLGLYLEEVNELLGKPFRVNHIHVDIEEHPGENSYFYISWTNT